MLLAPADNNGKYVRERWLIAAAYLKGWFILDLVSTIPLELFIQSKHVGAMQLFRVRNPPQDLWQPSRVWTCLILLPTMPSSQTP
jgi:hypothetical protein